LFILYSRFLLLKNILFLLKKLLQYRFSSIHVTQILTTYCKGIKATCSSIIFCISFVKSLSTGFVIQPEKMEPMLFFCYKSGIIRYSQFINKNKRKENVHIYVIQYCWIIHNATYTDTYFLFFFIIMPIEADHYIYHSMS